MRSSQDFDDEIRAHIELETDRLIAEGVPPAEAAARARRAFGNELSASDSMNRSDGIGFRNWYGIFALRFGPCGSIRFPRWRWWVLLLWALARPAQLFR